MKIELRIADADLGTVQNVMFKPKRQFKMALLPLPPEEWVGKQVCSVCGGEPKFLQESMQPICQKCIHQIMSGLNKKESNAETSIPITMEIVAHSRFEWSVDGEKWYSLMGRNIKVDRPEIFLKELKKSILEKHPMNVEVEYTKETKEMTIIL